MNKYCKCKGIMQSICDNNLYFVFQCQVCGKTVKQRKRQSKEHYKVQVKLITNNDEKWY